MPHRKDVIEFEYIDNNLSLSKILRKIVEIEKIKYFLFDEDQLTVFESMPKPIISANEKGPAVKDNGLLIGEIKKFNDKFFHKEKRGSKIQLKQAYTKIFKKKMTRGSLLLTNGKKQIISKFCQKLMSLN